MTRKTITCIAALVLALALPVIGGCDHDENVKAVITGYTLL